jgi:Sulfatase-modifying factor enzyme 1/Caspase domain
MIHFHQPDMLHPGLALLLLIAGVVPIPPTSAQDVVALCIGNDAYMRAEDVLDTPVADALLMKRTFEGLPGGADVILLTDANREGIVIALNSLVQKSKGAKLVVVYYSGHGLEGQPDGFNKPETFLLPVDAEIPDVNYLPTRAVGLQVVLEALQKCPVTARAVILDCCRHGAPKATAALAGSTKSFGDIDESVKSALGSAVVPEATLVAFATSPGRKAAAFLRQSDTNSPFTLFLSESLQTGTGNLRDLVEVAAERTEEATGRRQIPYVTYTGAASAIRQIVFRQTGAPGLLTTPGNSLDMAAMRAHLAAAEKARQEALRHTGIEGLRTSEVREFGGIEMVWCPPGEFMMGNPDRGPYYYPDAVPHLVTLTKGFWLAKTEVTQRQWAAVMGDNPSKFKQENLPVDSVSWEDAQGYLAQMNQQHPLPSGWSWSLPTEAQWEYACRGGQDNDA